VIFSGCFSASSSDRGANGANGNLSSDYAPAKRVAKIESDEIKESSGLAVSRCRADVFWTHNDSGDGPYLYAFNSKGQKLGTWKVPNAKNDDWEDLTTFKSPSGECSLLIGDIGNNERVKSEFTIYRVREPEISDSDRSSSKKAPLATDSAEIIKGEYPDRLHDAETLMIHPVTGDIYLLTKRITGAAGVYKLAPGYALDKTNRLKKIADITVPAIPDGLLTGGDISPDGRRVIICDYFNAYELVLPESAVNFDEIWQQEPKIVELGKREQGEAIAYSSDGKSLFATSEKRNPPLIEVRRK
jgi:hypothetical protein